MRWLTHSRRLTAIVRVILVALAVAPSVASACAIDNKASLFIGGVQATLNTASPTNTALWAPFTIAKAFAAGDTLSMSELRSDLAKTLSPATLAAPYRWVFGDGASALGHAVTHRYARPGLYRLAVYGYDKATGTWSSFDQALVRVVSPGQVLQANLGYYALRALDVGTSGLMWGIDALLVLAVLYVVFGKWRTRRAGLPRERHAGSPRERHGA